VHGLNGSGYRSWKTFPLYLFEGRVGQPVDIAVYDYVTFMRRLHGRGASLSFCVRQLVGSLSELDQDYESIFLLGHSLGGVVAEAVAKQYLQDQRMPGPSEVTPLAALILMAAPRAGSAWAFPLFQGFIREFRRLKRLSESSYDVDDFFSTFVQTDNTAYVHPGKTLLPRYACIGGADRFVSSFSAGFGIPKSQKLYLSEGHSSIVKPSPGKDEQVRWLLKVMAEVQEVRRQREREDRHSATRTAMPSEEPPATLVTEFWGDTNSLLWEETYNKARRAASTADMLIQDNRVAPDSAVDLLISVSDANAVLREEQTEKDKVVAAYNRRKGEARLNVGISSVGPTWRRAEQMVDQWLSAQPWLPGIFVEGVRDQIALEGVILRWLQLLIERDPSRSASPSMRTERLLRRGSSLYDPVDGGTQ
jgi:pimeloyl-ACP methyl ester carboxylesterase